MVMLYSSEENIARGVGANVLRPRVNTKHAIERIQLEQLISKRAETGIARWRFVVDKRVGQLLPSLQKMEQEAWRRLSFASDTGSYFLMGMPGKDLTLSLPAGSYVVSVSDGLSSRERRVGEVTIVNGETTKIGEIELNLVSCRAYDKGE